jgi:hypothetical protein
MSTTIEPLGYDAYLPGRSIEVVRGTADVEGRETAWSAIRKRTDPMSPALERGRREASAYSSGLLTSLVGLAAPRAFLAEVDSEGGVDLWLELVSDDVAKWTMSEYRHAAEALGRFNARFHEARVPVRPWFVHDWADRQSEPRDVDSAVGDIERFGSDESVCRALGDDVATRATRLLIDQSRFKSVLARLPQTLCHHDAARSNLLASWRENGDPQIVAIDWESVGPGPVGADIATLVSGSLRKGDADPDRAAELDDAVFEGYLTGLRAGGLAIESRSVRLGYTLALSLRFWFVRDTLRILSEPQVVPMLGRATHVPPDQVREAFASIGRFVLDRADEARRLMP